MRDVMKVIVVFGLLALTACAGVPQTPTSSALDLGAEKTFTFKSVDADGNKLQPVVIANALQQAIYGTSGYKRRFEQYSSNHIYDVKGIEVTQLPNQIMLAYVNGERYADSGRTYATRSRAIFGYRMEEGADTIKVAVIPPTQLETVKQSSPLYIPYSQFAPDEKLAADVRQIYTNLNPEIMVNKWVTGEVNTNYGVDAITANFKRKCRTSAVTGPGTLTCMVGNQSVSVSVMPYQAGSKASYKFLVQYRLDGNGGTTYSDEATKQTVTVVEKIVKD